MKQFVYLLGIIFLFTLQTEAQIYLYLSEQELTIKEETYPAWVFPLAGAPEEALKDLDKFCRQRNDINMKRVSNDLLMAKKVRLPAVSKLRGDLIGYAFNLEPEQRMGIVFLFGYDIALNSRNRPVEMESMRKYVKSFMSYHFEQEYNRQLKIQEKELAALERERGQDLKKINQLTNKINNLGKKIGKATETADIEALEKEIRSLEAEVRQFMDLIPGLDQQIIQHQDSMDQLLAESHQYLGTIGNL